MFYAYDSTLQLSLIDNGLGVCSYNGKAPHTKTSLPCVPGFYAWMERGDERYKLEAWTVTYGHDRLEFDVDLDVKLSGFKAGGRKVYLLGGEFWCKPGEVG